MAFASVGHGGGPAAVPPVAAAARRRRRATPYLLLLPGIAWLVVFFAMPIGTLFSTSLMAPGASGAMGDYVPALNVANYVDALQRYWAQYLRSFLYAGLATVLALALAYPLAYFIAQKAGRMRNILLVLVVAPFFVSFVLRTLAWRQLLGEEGYIVPVIRYLHLIPAGATVTASPVAVVMGLTYTFLPFMTLPIYASLERVDPRLIEAGGDLYANAFTTFRKVTFPLSLPGVVAGTLLTFIPASGDYVNATLLGRPPQTVMIGNVIEANFFKLQDYPTVAVLSFVLMATILALVTVYIRRAGTEDLV